MPLLIRLYRTCLVGSFPHFPLLPSSHSSLLQLKLPLVFYYFFHHVGSSLTLTNDRFPANDLQLNALENAHCHRHERNYFLPFPRGSGLYLLGKTGTRVVFGDTVETWWLMSGWETAFLAPSTLCNFHNNFHKGYRFTTVAFYWLPPKLALLVQ
jgi:hypothetical protein